MNLWITTRCCRTNRLCTIPVIIFVIVLCFIMFYFNRYNYKIRDRIPSAIGKTSDLGNSKSAFPDILHPLQLHLWKSVKLPAEGEKKTFSFARHGSPLDLYFAGKPSRDAPQLVNNLNMTSFRNVLSYGQTQPLSVSGVTCPILISGKKIKLKSNNTLADSGSIIYEDNCKSYMLNNRYITSPVTKLEQNFSLAFSMLIYTDFPQFEQLLRTIYRPQNIYCIHMDKKSNKNFVKSVKQLVDCFPNVFLTPRSVNVQWGEFSVLEPELICIEELLKRHKTWKYFINLTGQEFPLRTNYELVKILDSINGANLVEGTVKRDNTDRWKDVGPPPHGITPTKGSIHVVLSRRFVDSAINSKIGKDLLDWCRKVRVPDELFFSSLHNNPHLNISGSYKGEPETNNNTNPHLARFKNWESDWPCQGKGVRNICVFGVGDLPYLATREELFANKFIQDFQPATLGCLEELLRNRTWEETLGTLGFKTTYYRTRDFVTNKV